jgi:hypothetical protein
MSTVKQLAGELYRALEPKTRDNGDIFYSLKEGSPEWMTDAIRAAHDSANMLPDDWRYERIHDAAAAIEDADDIADAGDEFADGVDVYNAKLLAWAGSHAFRVAYCDDAMDEFGKPESLAQLLQWGQMTERREVFDQLADFLASIADDDSNDEDESEG